MKQLLAILLLCVTVQGLAQDPLLQKSNPELEALAKDITKKYDKQLAMRAEQRKLFEMKVEEFLIRAEDIKKKFKGEEELSMLYKLQGQESNEMGDILTRMQMRLYRQLKPELQPLKQLKKKGD